MPRIVVAQLFEKYGDMLSDTQILNFFGSPPYTFTECDSRGMSSAPLREFGLPHSTLSALQSRLKNFPLYLQKEILKYKLGAYVDKKGRFYKLEDESENIWTVLIPSKRGVKIEFPNHDEPITLRCKEGNVRNFVVSDILVDKKATAIIFLTPQE